MSGKKQVYDLEERLLEYSVRIIKLVEKIPNTRAGIHVSGQLLRSGTSPYPERLISLHLLRYMARIATPAPIL
jgi:hypothetical protein